MPRGVLGGDQAAVGDADQHGPFDAGGPDHLVELCQVVLEARRFRPGEAASRFIGEREGHDAAERGQRLDGGHTPLVATLEARDDNDRPSLSALDDSRCPHQFLSGLPVVSVCWMRASVFARRAGRGTPRVRGRAGAAHSRSWRAAGRRRRTRGPVPGRWCVVVGGPPGPPRQVHAELERRAERIRRRREWPGAAAASGSPRRTRCERLGLGVGDQALAVHRDGVERREVAEAHGIRCRWPRPSRARPSRRPAARRAADRPRADGRRDIARTTISLVPPPAGMSPTPTSTSPM